MGEIAEMMLDGTMDRETGEFLFDGADGPGFPLTAREAENMGWPQRRGARHPAAHSNPPVISVGRYPEDGRDRGQCVCCEQPATGYVLVRYGDGQPTPEPSCGRHRKMAMRRDGRFWAHMKTKERYLAGELPTKPGAVCDAV